MPTIPRTQEDYQNDNILSGLNWDAVDRELLRGSLPVFEDENEMRAFYQKLALLFCPEARNFPANSYLRLVLYCPDLPTVGDEALLNAPEEQPEDLQKSEAV